MKNIEKPRLEQRIPRRLSLEQADVLLRAIHTIRWTYKFEKQKNLAIIALMLFAWLRKSEVLKLKTHNINMDTSIIHIVQAKWKKDRLVPMCSRLIYKILNNEMYYGEYYYWKTSFGKGNLSKNDWAKINEKKKREEPINMSDYTPVALLTIPCPPILSDDPDEAKKIFLETQAVLALWRWRNQPKWYKYVFSGKLISGDTWYKFTGYKNKSNNYYYRIHKDKTKNNYDKREKRNISEKELVWNIMSHMKEILKKPKSELAQMYNIKFQNWNKQGLEENELDLIEKEVKNLERRKRSSYEDKQNNIIDLNEYIVIKNEYEERIRLLEDRKKNLNKLIQNEIHNFDTALRIKKILLKFEEAFNNLTYEEQKEFCELVVSEITIYKHTKIITLNFSEWLLDFFEKSDPDDDIDGWVIPYSKWWKKPKWWWNSWNNPMSKLVKSFSELESINLDGGEIHKVIYKILHCFQLDFISDTNMLQLQQLGLHLPRLKYRDRWDKIKRI